MKPVKWKKEILSIIACCALGWFGVPLVQAILTPVVGSSLAGFLSITALFVGIYYFSMGYHKR